MHSTIQVGIVGGTGYTGAELLRLLTQHPNVHLAQITSRGEAGKPVSALFPHLSGRTDLHFSAPDALDADALDVVFYATPNGIAMHKVPELLAKGVKVIDLAADFRLKDIATWEQWYGMPHACPETLAQAVYGLPEFNREAIRTAQLIANPGCHATAVQLALFPLLKAGLIDHQDIIADSKSGVSGAGRGAAVGTLYSEIAESFKPYKVEGHRHHPEIIESLAHATGERPSMLFTPHLVPMIRGIECTLYAKPLAPIETLQQAMEACYADEPFVSVLPAGSMPDTAHVRGSNHLHVSLASQTAIQDKPDRIIIMSVEDNLIKGAAGQAIQSMNLALGLDEQTGLTQIACLP